MQISKGNRTGLSFSLLALALVLTMGWIVRPTFGVVGGAPASSASPNVVRPNAPSGAGNASSMAGRVAASGDGVQGTVKVGRDDKHDVSPPLRDVKPEPPVRGKAPENEPAPMSAPS